MPSGPFAHVCLLVNDLDQAIDDWTKILRALDPGQLEKRIVRYDDFVVAITMPDGLQRSFRRNGDVPTVQINDPRDAHRKLWPTLADKDMHDVTAYLVTLK